MNEEYDILIGKLITHRIGDDITYYVIDHHYVWDSEVYLVIKRLKDWDSYQIRPKWILLEQHGWRLVN
jgi:hypothetical protein